MKVEEEVGVDKLLVRVHTQLVARKVSEVHHSESQSLALQGTLTYRTLHKVNSTYCTLLISH